MSKETHEELCIDLIRVHNGVATRAYEWVLNIPEIISKLNVGTDDNDEFRVHVRCEAGPMYTIDFSVSNTELPTKSEPDPTVKELGQ